MTANIKSDRNWELKQFLCFLCMIDFWGRLLWQSRLSVTIVASTEKNIMQDHRIPEMEETVSGEPTHWVVTQLFTIDQTNYKPVLKRYITQVPLKNQRHAGSMTQNDRHHIGSWTQDDGKNVLCNSSSQHWKIRLMSTWWRITLTGKSELRCHFVVIQGTTEKLYVSRRFTISLCESNDDNIDSCLIIELTAKMQQSVQMHAKSPCSTKNILCIVID
jgi:hypothetical protein